MKQNIRLNLECHIMLAERLGIEPSGHISTTYGLANRYLYHTVHAPNHEMMESSRKWYANSFSVSITNRLPNFHKNIA